MSRATTDVGRTVPPAPKPSDQRGLEDFWRVYDAHYEEISNDAQTLLADDPDFGPVLASMTQQQREEQNRESRERMRRAIVEGEWDPYFSELRVQGFGYAQMGVSFAGWFRLLSIFRPLLSGFLLDALREMPDRLRSAIGAMDEFIDGAMAVIGEEYLRAKEEIISHHQEAIRELSTPVLQVRDDMLLVPVVGVIDSTRARQMTDQLLQAIRAKRAKVVVIDITGVAAVDSMVANHLVQAVEAARLLGAHAILTGLSAEVAQTVVRIGVDLSKVRTTGSLQDGIGEANRMLGYTVVRSQ
ncbi:MAG: STAS domain-containing protein [Actinomycetota bacterium]